MPPRRNHRKSRNGCDPCKKRRVKCDEHGPPCGNCSTREIDCHFSRPRPLPTNSNSQSPAQVVSANEEKQITERSSADPAPSSSTRLLELELLHYYSSKTYLGFSFGSNDKELWQEVVVQEALKSEFLLKEIFALAALHKATETPESDINYVACALEYQNEASALFRNALGNITKANCFAIFAFSIMTMIFGIVPSELTSGINNKSPLENILLLFEFQKGTSSVAGVGLHWLKSSQFGFAFSSGGRTIASNLDESYRVAISRLRDMNNSSTPLLNINNRRREIDLQAINSLESCYLGSNGKVIAWLAMAGQEFINELKHGEPMALLILVHWGVFLDRLGDLWWARDSGKRLVEELSGILAGLGPYWHSATYWAREQVGLTEAGHHDGIVEGYT
ncbi:fungal Zn binuclear cluster domain-containing protein [Halenospora varia]|nr:fungal Zn binuclear cluster domain-containing protein [Halenospora varia]